MSGELYVRDLWYMPALSASLKPGAMRREMLLGEPVLLGRMRDGTAFAMRDICPHRGVPLSAGKILAEYTVERQSTFSTIMAELEHEAQEAGIQSRPVNTELDPVEGSDSLYQLSINASYEGSYSNLTKLINLLDKSPRFLIIESLTAAPQQSQQANAGDLLSVNIKVDTFVRGKPGNPI